MKKSNVASIDSIETMGLVDGPGIRTVIFFNGCKLRCKFCHNPEMWNKRKNNITVDELVNKIKRSKPYFKDTGGVTFSGGEPLLQADFIKEVAKRLHEEGINTCLDTAGVGLGNYEEVLKHIDYVLLDIKHTNNESYKYITGKELKEVENFIDACNKTHKKIWIRQVIIPGITDSDEYMESLLKYLMHIKGIERIDFLPYHRLGREKYLKLNIPYPFEDKNDMDKDKCNILYNNFINKFNKIYEC